MLHIPVQDVIPAGVRVPHYINAVLFLLALHGTHGVRNSRLATEHHEYQAKSKAIVFASAARSFLLCCTLEVILFSRHDMCAGRKGG